MADGASANRIEEDERRQFKPQRAQRTQRWVEELCHGKGATVRALADPLRPLRFDRLSVVSSGRRSMENVKSVVQIRPARPQAHVDYGWNDKHLAQVISVIDQLLAEYAI